MSAPAPAPARPETSHDDHDDLVHIPDEQRYGWTLCGAYYLDDYVIYTGEGEPCIVCTDIAKGILLRGEWEDRGR